MIARLLSHISRTRRTAPSLVAATTFIVTFAMNAAVSAAPATTSQEKQPSLRYQYYYRGQTVELHPSPQFIVIQEGGKLFSDWIRSNTLERDRHSDHPALKPLGLGLYRRPSPKSQTDRLLNLGGQIQSLAEKTTRTVQPVFEQGSALLIPSDEVIVGFDETTTVTLAAGRAYLAPYMKRLGIMDVKPHRKNTFILTINNPSNGRCYAVSRDLAKVDRVAFAEPNHLIIMLDPITDPALIDSRPLEKLIPSDKTGGAAPAQEPKGGGADTVQGPRKFQTPPTWTTIGSIDFESSTFPPSGWRSSYYTGYTAACWNRTAYRSHGGSYSMYCASSGTASVAPPGPARLNMAAFFRSPTYNLTGYEEVYLECWFYAKNDLWPGPGGTLYDYAGVYVFDKVAGTGWGYRLGTPASGDCTIDPTTANGWRRCLLRVPEKYRVAQAYFEFRYISDGVDQYEGAYIDDVRIVGTAEVDTDPLGNDTFGARHWEHRNVGQIAALGNDNNDMHTVEAWGLVAVSNATTMVAVVDSGVELTHPDLNLTAGYEYNGAAGGGPKSSSDYHGTAVAGVVGAIRNNARGVIGTAPNCKILPIYYGSSTAYYASAIDQAVLHGARIVSNSWGWVGAPSTDITNAITNALAAGRTVVFAAGNGPDRSPWTYDVAYPGSLTASTDVICVGASSPTDEYKGAASSDGEYGWGSSYLGVGPDVCAPGPWSYTTDRQGTAGANDGTLHLFNADYNHGFSGTSAATPKVAGIAALLLSANPNLTPHEVKEILRATADDIDVAGIDDRTGWGRVNAYRAVRSLTTVDAHSSPQPNRVLEAWRDTQAEKAAVLKFRVTDHGQDSSATLVDRVIVKVTGTAGHASNDIAWAEITNGVSQLATAASISDSQIVFGITPNSNGAAYVSQVPNNSYVEYTVNLYLSASILGHEGDTYVLDIDETCTGLDSRNSSRMWGDSGAVTPVTCTLDVAPTVSMTSASPDPTNASAIPVTVTFSESVTGFTASDITASNAAVDSFSGSGANYSFSLTPSEQGLVTANIAVGVAQDVGSNGNFSSPQLSRTYDSIPPSVSMSSTAPDPTNTRPIPVRVTFSEPVVGFTASDITVSSAIVTNFRGSGTSYSFDLQPWYQGLLTADIAASVAQDAATNGNTASPQFSRTYISPTAIRLSSFCSTRYRGVVLLEWRTGYEVNNLGFHVYREEGGRMRRLTEQMVAGSAFLAGAGTNLTAGASYSWWDVAARGSGPVRYWLEDIDLNGKRTRHGPVTPVVSARPLPLKSRAALLAQLGRVAGGTAQRIQSLETKLRNKPVAAQSGSAKPLPLSSRRLVKSAARQAVAPSQAEVQWWLAGRSAVKLNVRKEGWYQVGQPELVAAGLDPSINPRFLQLYADGEEQPLFIADRDRRLEPSDTIEFYGTGQDTPWTDARTYWLVAGPRRGQRIPVVQARSDRASGPQCFLFTVERKDRTVYFPALKNGEADNFFGPIITTQGADQLVTAPHLAPSPPSDATLEIALQGGTAGPHRVLVLLNNAAVGTIVFNGQEHPVAAVSIPQAALLEGDNLVRLVAQGGETDISVVDCVRLTYWHSYMADADSLRCTAPGGQTVTIDGFSSAAIVVVDITRPTAPRKLVGSVQPRGTSYAVAVKAPAGGQRTLLVLTDDAIRSPAAIAANRPSTWHAAGQGADVAIVSNGAFLSSLGPLKSLRESQGRSVALIDVEDLYDEFNFGGKSPWALRDFLARTRAQWQTAPRFVLLVGDAGVDPRNYLGLGEADFVPTKLVETTMLETASDDWFADLNGDDLPEMAVGRLPVRTAAEAAVAVAKIVAYEQAAPGDWATKVLLVADNNDVFDFEGASAAVAGLLPAGLTVDGVFLGWTNITLARSMLMQKLNAGRLLVNYIGHGSVDTWASEELLTNADAAALTNSPRLPFVISMTCLNGFLHDPYTDSLAEALLKAERGGAIAVWASSGLTEPFGQAAMDKELIRLLFGGQSPTIGEATARAKTAVSDQDIRRTWILFGDPAMRLK